MTRAGLLLLGFLVSTAVRGTAARPEGRLIVIGQQKLHLLCQGSGSPAVILESGEGEFSFDWALVLPALARVTRVCAWDRPGYASSDMSRDFEQFPAVAQDLRALLHKAGIQPPYVLAGHAFGALYARDYQRRYPGEVAGLVLVDPTPEEDTEVQMAGNTVSLLDMADHDLRAWPIRPFAPSRTSPAPRRPVAGQGGDAAFDRLPPSLRALRNRALNRLFAELDGLSSQEALAVMESERATFVELYNARHNPATSPLNLPLIVLSRGRDTTAAIGAMQDEQARLSRNVIHRIVDGSGTQIQIERPDLVASAAIEVVQAIRTGRPLKRDDLTRP